MAHRNGQARIARDTGPWFNSTADFAAFQARYELMCKWDALVEYRWLSVDQNDSERHGWLIGLDRHVGDNFRAYRCDQLAASNRFAATFLRTLSGSHIRPFMAM